MALSQGPTLRVPHTRDVHEGLTIAANLLNVVKARYTELEGVSKRMRGNVNTEELHHSKSPNMAERTKAAITSCELLLGSTTFVQIQSLWHVWFCYWGQKCQ